MTPSCGSVRRSTESAQKAQCQNRAHGILSNSLTRSYVVRGPHRRNRCQPGRMPAYRSRSNESHLNAFDLIIGSDGVHSNTWNLVFANDAESLRPLGVVLSQAISQVLRDQGSDACSRWFSCSAHATLTANEQRPSRTLRRCDRANSRRDAFARLPSPGSRDDDPGIEPGVHRWFGRECWTTGDRSEFSFRRRRHAVDRQCLSAAPERAAFARRSRGRPLWAPSSPDRRRSAVRHRVFGLRGGADACLVAACALRAGRERRHADAK